MLNKNGGNKLTLPCTSRDTTCNIIVYTTITLNVCYHQGIFVSECFPNVNIPLYADDLVLCSDTAGGGGGWLQNNWRC